MLLRCIECLNPVENGTCPQWQPSSGKNAPRRPIRQVCAECFNAVKIEHHELRVIPAAGRLQETVGVWKKGRLFWAVQSRFAPLLAYGVCTLRAAPIASQIASRCHCCHYCSRGRFLLGCCRSAVRHIPSCKKIQTREPARLQFSAVHTVCTPAATVRLMEKVARRHCYACTYN